MTKPAPAAAAAAARADSDSEYEYVDEWVSAHEEEDCDMGGLFGDDSDDCGGGGGGGTYTVPGHY